MALTNARAQTCTVPRQIADLTTSPTQSAFSTSQTLYVHDGLAYFSAFVPGSGNVLYVSDGTSAGTVPYSPSVPAAATVHTPIAWSAGGLVDVDISGGRASVVTPSGASVFDPGFRQAVSNVPLSQHFLDIGSALVYLGQPSGQPINVYGVTFAGGTPIRQTLLTLPATDWRVSQLVKLGSKCIFAINRTSTSDSMRIYSTDGTPSGTVELIDSSLGCTTGSCTLRGYVDDFLILSGRVYFARFVDIGLNAASWQLWSTDGTPSGTSPVPGISSNYLNGRPQFLGVIGSKIIMYGFTDFAVPPGTTSGLHVYDTAAGTISFVPYLTASPMSADRTRAIDLGGRLVFAGRNSGLVPDTQGTEPWVTDGTIPGTFSLGDLNPGLSNSINVSQTSAGVVVNGRAIFGATVSSAGTLWSSDGTIAGTQQITDTTAVNSPVVVGTFLMLSTGDRGYFGATSAAAGYEPWITDGTLSGTRMLADLLPGTASSNSVGFAQIASGVVFHAVGPDVGNELHLTDGVSTTLVKDIAGGTVSSEARMLARENGALLFVFSAQSGVTGVYEWQGSKVPPVLRLTPPATPLGSQPFGLEYLPGVGTYFTTPSQLYLASANLNSAVQVTGVPPNLVQIPVSGNSPLPHALVGTRMIFPAIPQGITPTTGQELCMTDGTPGGTGLLKDIASGSVSSGPTSFLSLGARAMFYATTPQTGYEPWGTDGTEMGTQLLGDLNPGSLTSQLQNPDQSPSPPVAFNGRAYFVASVNSGGLRKLYSSDATPAGTAPVDLGMVQPAGLLSAADSALYFVGAVTPRTEVYATDGTLAGTRVVSDLSLSLAGVSYRFVQAAGARAYFAISQSSPTRGRVYVTSGTLASTVEVPWPVAGQTPTSLYSAGVVRGKLLYIGLVSTNNYQLCVTDGTPGGTCVLGPWTGDSVLSSSWIKPTVVNSRVFVSMTDPVLGKEPVVFDFCPADFNNSGGDPTVQDVFDFLNAFFAGDASADVNNSGGAPTVQDVFTFLATWFAGCA